VDEYQERHLAHKNIPLIPRGPLQEKVEEQDLKKNWLIQVHLGKWPLNGSSDKVYFFHILSIY